MPSVPRYNAVLHSARGFRVAVRDKVDNCSNKASFPSTVCVGAWDVHDEIVEGDGTLGRTAKTAEGPCGGQP